MNGRHESSTRLASARRRYDRGANPERHDPSEPRGSRHGSHVLRGKAGTPEAAQVIRPEKSVELNAGDYATQVGPVGEPSGNFFLANSGPVVLRGP